MKRLTVTLLLIISYFGLWAQSDLLPKGLTAEPYTNEFLDTLEIRKELKINDYSMIGISYGASSMSIPKNYYDESACSTVILTTTPVDFSKYGKMTVVLAVGASYEGRIYSSYVGYTLVPNPYTYQSANSSQRFISLVSAQKVTTQQTVEVDLSLRTGICYPAINLPGEMSMTIYKWVLTA